MSKKGTRFILLFLFIAAISAAVFITRFLSRTKFNDSSVIGNSACNLYNGGLFCERNGIIYFSNDKDDGALYSMNMELADMKKLSGDKPYYLNADEHYIYYSRANYTQENAGTGILRFYNHGLYRIGRNGRNQKALSNDITDSLILSGNDLLYQLYDRKEGLFLYKMKIDGSGNELVSKVNIKPFSIQNRMVYYAPDSTADDHHIHTLNLENNDTSVLYTGGCYMPAAAEDGIFYISLDDQYHICKIDFNGKNKRTIVNEFCSFYNISIDEKYLFYQIDGGDHNRIAMMDLTSMTQTTIRDGNYKNIHVTGSYVFFRDFNEENTYLYDIESGILNIFNAPVIK